MIKDGYVNSPFFAVGECSVLQKLYNRADIPSLGRSYAL